MDDKDNKNMQSGGNASQDGFLDDFANVLEDNILKDVKNSAGNAPSNDADFLEDFDLSFLDEELELQKTPQQDSAPNPTTTSNAQKIDWEADFARAVQAAGGSVAQTPNTQTPNAQANIVPPVNAVEKTPVAKTQSNDDAFDELYDMPSPVVTVRPSADVPPAQAAPRPQAPQPSSPQIEPVLGFNFEQELQNLIAEDVSLQPAATPPAPAAKTVQPSKTAPVADNHEDDFLSPVFASAEAAQAAPKAPPPQAPAPVQPQAQAISFEQQIARSMPGNATQQPQQEPPVAQAPRAQAPRTVVNPDIAFRVQRTPAQKPVAPAPSVPSANVQKPVAARPATPTAPAPRVVTPHVAVPVAQTGFDQSSLVDSLEETLQELGAEFAAKSAMANPAPQPTRAPQPQAPIAPEVSTFQFENKSVAPTQNFDIPNVPYQQANVEQPVDPLEQEFAEVFKVGHSAPSKGNPLKREEQEFFAQAARQNASATAPQYNMGPELAVDDWDDYDEDPAYASYPGNRWTDERNPTYQAPQAARGKTGRRYVGLAGFGVLALLLIGGAYYVFSGGSELSNPVTIQADNTPIKVPAEGSAQQNKAPEHQIVYNRASGDNAQQTAQGQLVDQSEAPQDIAALNERAPSANDRLNPGNVQDAVNAASGQSVQQRVVYTVVVNPDGSVVSQPSTVDVPQTANNSQATTATANTAAPTDDGSRERFVIDPNVLSASLNGNTQNTANNAVPSRPASSPLHGNDAPPASLTTPVRGQQSVAPAAPQVAATATPTSGDFYVQLSSQPTEDLARSELGKAKARYGSVIGNRPMAVQRADIAGKGTYYRVRIQAGSRENAIALCESLRNNGGSCFVSR